MKKYVIIIFYSYLIIGVTWIFEHLWEKYWYDDFKLGPVFYYGVTLDPLFFILSTILSLILFAAFSKPQISDTVDSVGNKNHIRSSITLIVIFTIVFVLMFSFEGYLIFLYEDKLEKYSIIESVASYLRNGFLHGCILAFVKIVVEDYYSKQQKSY